ncbi:hypothetical protein A4G26_26165 [Mycobacterium kansasii]|nr:hypothetical protein A4G26_26165 [Mycobacterium kansasii]
MINQFGSSIGFYMLMPYLSSYLAGTLGLAVWAVGLVLGVRNFSRRACFSWAVRSPIGSATNS